jgi:hypothetical protein
MRFSNGRAVVFFYPSFVYDLAQFAMFPVNAAIGGMCRLQPSGSVWNAPDFRSRPVEGTGTPVSELRRTVLDGHDVAFDEADLVRLYDSLPTVSAADDVVGHTYRGRILRTNRSVLDLAEWALVRPLTRLGFGWGKRYRTADKGDPLLVDWQRRIFAPIPAWGNVGLTDIRWRGEPTATMNYDHQPWKDYFRRLSDDGDPTVVLLGVWTHKHIAGGWFTLTLDPETPADPRARGGDRA